MFRPMRRARQALDEAACREILERATAGVLSVTGDDGWPYGVPLSFALHGNEIVFHCAREGHKLDAIRAEERVCFTVIDRDEIVGAELTTYFRSVICFGRARLLTDWEEKSQAHLAFSMKYSAAYPEKIRKEIDGGLKNMEMAAITIEHMSGKEAIELVRAREAAEREGAE